MSLVGKNGTPAERQRGLIFVEDFRSVDDVVRNGMVVGGGTPTFGPGYVTFDGASYAQYPIGNTTVRGTKSCSIEVELTATSAAGTQLAVTLGNPVGVNDALCIGISAGTWQVYVAGAAFVDTGRPVVVGERVRICATTPGGAGGTVRTYANGVAGGTRVSTVTFVPSLINIGSLLAAVNYYSGQIHSIRIFDQELSPEEVLQYATNNVYSYRSRPTIYLPMTNACHTATATLDTSGNGRSAVFGAGVAAPTKLVGRHGYDFDGGDNMTTTLNGAFNTSEITIALEFEPDLAAASGVVCVWCDAEAGSRYTIFQWNTNDLYVILGNQQLATSVPVATYGRYWYQKARNVFVVSGKSGKSNFWLNGVRLLTDEATVWTAKNALTLTIGATAGLVSNFDGRITRFAAFPQALTTLQVYDLLTNWQMRASEA
jgi:hypothetical protein